MFGFYGPLWLGASTETWFLLTYLSLQRSHFDIMVALEARGANIDLLYHWISMSALTPLFCDRVRLQTRLRQTLGKFSLPIPSH